MTREELEAYVQSPAYQRDVDAAINALANLLESWWREHHHAVPSTGDPPCECQS